MVITGQEHTSKTTDEAQEGQVAEKEAGNRKAQQPE